MVTLYDLGLTEDDFKVEFIECSKPEYNDPFNPLRPERYMTAKVNGILCKIRTSVNLELLHDLESTGVDVKKEVGNMLKSEAIIWYINSKRYIRKQKLLKIKERYGV
jgi:hypothetical protein